MKLVESRRLTGPNLYSRQTGAVAQIEFEPEERPEDVLERWEGAVREATDALGWSEAERYVRRFVSDDGVEGAALMITAGLDQLFAATEVNEWALTRAGLTDAQSPDPLPVSLTAVEASAREEAAKFRSLMVLVEAARARGCPWMVDDERVTLGRGPGACSYEPARAPAPEAVQWARFKTIPTVAITGTNGKTTCSRLVAAMLRSAGHRGVGNTSTDGIFVDGTLVDAGDWAGAGGARELVRRPDVQFGVLETARGGLLRRGMGVFECDAALITNVARDHMGDYGIYDLKAMADAKGAISHAVHADGAVVLCADSPPLVEWARAQTFEARLIWYSVAADNSILEGHAGAGGEVWTVEDGWLVRRVGHEQSRLLPIHEMPITMAGTATFNVANALGAAALAATMGVKSAAIADALRRFGIDPNDNPARTQLWEVPVTRDGSETKTVPLLVDFAHNVAGVEALAPVLRAHAGPRVVCVGMAGDRSDRDLIALGRALRDFDPDTVVLREQPKYLRGRAAGEIPALLERGLRSSGDDAPATMLVESEVASLDAALERCGPDGCVALLVHLEREPVLGWLARRGATRVTDGGRSLFTATTTA
jgi:UDP-N-acetylmuramyl tripeptide synthase